MVAGSTFYFPGPRALEHEPQARLRPAPGELLVENQLSLISPGTELALYQGTHVGLADPANTFAKYPFYPGYDCVGQVVEGDEAGMLLVHDGPHAAAGIVRPGQSLHAPVPAGLAAADALFGLLAVIGHTAYAVRRHDPQLVLVIGAGLIGNLAAQIFAARAGCRVLITDLEPQRLTIARACGLDDALDGGDALAAQLAAATGGAAPDLVVEATGAPLAVVQALELVGRYGEVILLGSTRGTVEIDVYKLIHRPTVTLVGAHAASLDAYDSQPLGQSRMQVLADMLAAIASGELTVRPLLTHTLPPREAASAYEGLASRRAEYLGVAFDWQAA